MKKTHTPQQTDQEQLTRWARALARARPEELHNALARGSEALLVQMFVDSNLEKRRQKLEAQLESVVKAFDNFEDLLATYMRECAQLAYDTAASDGERFLKWLQRTGDLTPEQHDVVVCQRARHAVEAAGRADRHRHLRFQELWTVAEQLGKELDSNPDLCVHLNPLRVWTRFQSSALLDEAASPPVEVLFFPVRSEIRCAILDRKGRRVVKRLASISPCTISQWVLLEKHARKDELIEMCSDLAQLGLLAFS